MGAGRDHPAGVALLPLPASGPQGGGRRRAFPWRPALLTATLPVVSTAAAAQTESPGQTLKRVEQDLQTDKALQRQLDRQSQTLQKELDELRDRLVGLADQERAQEDELAHLEESLTALETQERSQAEKLEGERQQIAALLAALQRVARIPPEAALARPDGPVDTLRSALLLRDTVPALRARADALAQALTRLAETRETLQAQRGRTYAARLTLIDRQKEIGQLVARREELSRQTDEERQQVAQRTARLTGQAADLRQLMDRIEAERRAAAAMAAKREAERLEAERRLAEQRAAEQKAAEQKLAEQKAAEQRQAEQKLAEQRSSEQRARAETETARAAPGAPVGERLPVGGRVTVRYGEADRYGATSRGVTIQARSGSTVVSPQAGTIVFAGPFRGYGQILIVEHSHGYHSLIAGFGRIDTAVGRRVATGEPIGLMPADGSPDLYFELRRHGQPINPQRGFGAPEGKGQG
ncbi:peptidoglycan DD-metalloendopeptidase family protein [Azospirillum formosense]|uniref:Peptidoglycan DD-metalloendopeptidase family protein n=1 Tax=Azospirillum formosense TaxID=861533 RepID=A0ABX2LB20_9PROT|nr:peptidoglycan DD-metalloendopeptidase family protein [Azospirillum formosense]NUB22485.1 peptidoglycan DD-metalloendopeptidase family protein [Azospirillum formosense]